MSCGSGLQGSSLEAGPFAAAGGNGGTEPLCRSGGRRRVRAPRYHVLETCASSCEPVNAMRNALRPWRSTRTRNSSLLPAGREPPPHDRSPPSASLDGISRVWLVLIGGAPARNLG